MVNPSPTGQPLGHRSTLHSSPERLKAYTDAVVAIAQTLLILPLLESVSEARSHHLTTTGWLHENSALLLWFALSFVLIWSFWLVHQRVFDQVDSVWPALQAANAAWMFGIVFVPISTALLGLGHTEPLQVTLYIGSLLWCSLSMNVMAWLTFRQAALQGRPAESAPRLLSVSLSVTALFVLSLGLALALPGLGYSALYVMFLVPLVTRLITPLLARWR